MTGSVRRPRLLASQTGEGDWIIWVVLAVVGLAAYGGITLYRDGIGSDAPKMIQRTARPIQRVAARYPSRRTVLGCLALPKYMRWHLQIGAD